MRGFDPLYFFSISLLLGLGTIVLLSVAPQIFPAQTFYILLALFILFLVTRADKIILEAAAPFFFALVLVGLLITLFLGAVSHGAVRWIPLGPITFQASEFAKPALALMTAWILTVGFRQSLVTSLLPAALLLFLVFIQPDLGTTVVLGSAWFGAVLGAGVPIGKILRIGFLGLASLPIIWFLLAPYQRERIFSFLSPGDIKGASYQSLQAMIAAGSGGLLGRGLGQGSQTQLAFLPEHHTDFIFSSIGEELGFMGMFLALLAFLVLFGRIISGLGSARSQFERSAISGIFLYLFVQTFANIAMNLGLLPVAGIPLPLLSAGGSSLVATMVSLGIVSALRKS